jgi:hypothetical protein
MVMMSETVKNADDLRRSARLGDVEEAGIEETSVEARQGFLDRPVLVVLCASLAIAIGAGFIVWSSNL